MLVSVVGMWWSLSSDGEGCAYKIQRERREYSPIVEETAKTAIDTGRALSYKQSMDHIYSNRCIPSFQSKRDRISWGELKILPPYRIIGQMCILRQTLTINFSQENIKYLT
jgi:hypothetical protein